MSNSRKGAKAQSMRATGIMNENALSKEIVDSAFKIHTTLGPGLLESVYEVVLAHELRSRGLVVERQVAVPICYDGIQFEEGFRLDLLVEKKVIIEIKSVEKLTGSHKKQLLTYLRLMNTKLGLLINFNEEVIRTGITRIVNGLEDAES
jgi:GxxExxY protein